MTPPLAQSTALIEQALALKTPVKERNDFSPSVGERLGYRNALSRSAHDGFRKGVLYAMSSKWLLLLLGTLTCAALLLVPRFGRMDRFLCKGLGSCQTFSRDNRGRTERPSDPPEELRNCSRGGTPDSQLSKHLLNN